MKRSSLRKRIHSDIKLIAELKIQQDILKTKHINSPLSTYHFSNMRRGENHLLSVHLLFKKHKNALKAMYDMSDELTAKIVDNMIYRPITTKYVGIYVDIDGHYCVTKEYAEHKNALKARNKIQRELKKLK